MTPNEKLEQRKKENTPFLAAFERLCRERKITQAELARQMGTNSSLISSYRAGEKRASDDIKSRLVEQYAGRLNRPFLDGDSDYMLIADIPASADPSSQALDMSFFVEKAITKATAYADKAIATLENQLTDKEEIIALLRNRVQDLEEKLEHISRRVPDFPDHPGIVSEP